MTFFKIEMLGESPRFRRGISRAWIAFTVPWLIFWTWTFVDAKYSVNWNQEMISTMHAESRSSPNYFLSGALKEQFDFAVARRDQAEERAELAIKLGPSIPLGLAVLYLGSVWVRRGFLNL
jgi:hypothetical protein